MEFNRKFREEPEHYPEQIYFEDNPPLDALEIAEKFGLHLIGPEANNNDLMTNVLPYTIYVFTKFENNYMFRRVEKSPNTWILGPTALKQMVNNSDLEIRTKPTYCTFMYGFVFHINCPEDIPLMERTVQLLKWMGGLFCKEPQMTTTHMITTSTRAKGYTYCYTFNVPILSPAWVEYCWQQRDNPNFDVTSVMEMFKVKAFVGLYIAFKMFISEELILHEALARVHGAVIVTLDDPRCSHLVLPEDIAKHVNINDVPPSIPYVVTEKWFASCLEQKQRVYEENYRCFSLKEIKQSLWAVLDSEETISRQGKTSKFRASLKNEDKVSLDITVKESQDLKRKYAFEELVRKETNYLHCLIYLLKIRCDSTKENKSLGAILTQAEAKIIFGNLDKLVKIHKQIVESYKNVKVKWENDVITVKRIIDFKNELLKEYAYYTENYEESKRMIEVCQAKNKQFRKLLESSLKLVTKEHPKDMFIRPIQRLCSLNLQLHDMSKYTREDNPDKQVLKDAIAVVSDVLKRINNRKETVEKLTTIFDIHRLIKNCPPDLITSHRQLIIMFSAQEVVSKPNVQGMQVMFFLFNDILEITKIRKETEAMLKNIAFEKEIRLRNDALKNKLYKHITTIPLGMIINMILFKGTNEDDQNLFGINVRDLKNNSDTSTFCFQYSSDNNQELSDVLLLIAQQLALEDSSKSPRNYILDSMPTSRFSIDPIPLNTQGKLDLKKLFVLSTNKSKKPLRRSLSCNDVSDL